VPVGMIAFSANFSLKANLICDCPEEETHHQQITNERGSRP
jgi:hypothetical protein